MPVRGELLSSLAAFLALKPSCCNQHTKIKQNSLVDVAQLGMAGVPIVVGCIATGMVVVPWLGRKLGLNPKLAALTAAGTSICGVTAIVSLAPAIQVGSQGCTSFCPPPPLA